MESWRPASPSTPREREREREQTDAQSNNKILLSSVPGPPEARLERDIAAVYID